MDFYLDLMAVTLQLKIKYSTNTAVLHIDRNFGI